MKRFLFVAGASLLLLDACKALDAPPSSIPLGLVTTVTGDAPSVHMSSPSAYFVDASNVSIPNSASNADTCAEVAFPIVSNLAPLAQVDAGTPVLVEFTEDTAQLTPAPADPNGYIFYKLPANDSVRVVPGSTGRVVIPGATNFFHPFNFTFVNADSLRLDPIPSSPDSTHDLTLTWNPQIGFSASVVVQLEYGTSASTIHNEILCQFTDNGTHAVEASLANVWRAANVKRVHAYRFLSTFNNDGTDEVGVLSTYTTDSTVILP